MDDGRNSSARWRDELYDQSRRSNVTQFAYQKNHTRLGMDLERIAAGPGIKAARAICAEPSLTGFKRNMELSACRNRVRAALLENG